MISTKTTALTLLAFSFSTSILAEQITIATVNNSDMVRMQGLTDHFTKDNPDIQVKWVILDENTLRQRATTDIATRSGQYDVITIGTYETSIWAKRGWLVALDDFPSAYDIGDLLPTVRTSLSYKDVLYGAPFYGESSFTMYRTDLFEKAGLEMPQEPTWDFIKDAASKLTDHDNNINGICLRGKPGWGNNMALISAMVNSYGGRWFDMQWKSQLDSKEWSLALHTYQDLLKNYGPKNAHENGYTENLTLFKNGNCAIWIDATVAASSISDAKVSAVADKVGFALAPNTGLGKSSNWLWSWSLAVPIATKNKDAAKRFIAWSTSKEYTELVAKEYGWANVPPGTRSSLYYRPEYIAAAPFTSMSLASIKSANPLKPSVLEVPYTGIQYVSIPEFQGIGTAVGQQISDALSEKISMDKALKNAHWVTTKVIKHARFIK